LVVAAAVVVATIVVAAELPTETQASPTTFSTNPCAAQFVADGAVDVAAAVVCATVEKVVAVVVVAAATHAIHPKRVPLPVQCNLMPMEPLKI